MKRRGSVPDWQVKDTRMARLSTPELNEGIAGMHIASWEDVYQVVKSSLLLNHHHLLNDHDKNPILVRVEFDHLKTEFRFDGNTKIGDLYLSVLRHYGVYPFRLALVDYAVGVGHIYKDLTFMEDNLEIVCDAGSYNNRLPVKLFPDSTPFSDLVLKNLLTFMNTEG